MAHAAMSASALEASSAEPLCAEDRARADLYRLLASFLSRSPCSQDLTVAAGLKGNMSALGRAIDGFAAACAASTAAEADAEYQDIFIGLSRGELIPHGSYYLAGFLHEKPLARLRQDMTLLGIERDPAASEPEDHIASLLEVMAGLIDGRFGAPATLSEQQHFFDTHLGSWAHVFFRDLGTTASARLYAALAVVGSAFLDVEKEAFAMV